eukprot:CAMPEP_0114542796 /NCGR_PEP_ID=MMETSP0114-20121206/2019_1 /TAXON_ID=31324 /ORGANISM="Goniomonas sp, Strain m" /LENGTH=191 /DNA_ID=CAMNT_0001727103 /DNA_START=309 /DNA_END=885 /DNA_ORIENTATION=-
MPAWKPRSRRTCTSEVATVRSDFAQRVRFTINDTIKEVERLSPRDIRGDSAATAQGHKTDDPDYCVMAQIRQQRLKHLFGVQIRKAFATWRNLAHKSRIASELQDLPSRRRSPQHAKIAGATNEDEQRVTGRNFVALQNTIAVKVLQQRRNSSQAAGKQLKGSSRPSSWSKQQARAVTTNGLLQTPCPLCA